MRAKRLTRAVGELPYQAYLANNHRPGFDGLRALGFLLVITAHVPSVPLFGMLQGWSAVWVFFVISGYLIAMLMMREEKRSGRVAFGPFLVKRIFRILPAYFMAIAIYWLACLTLEPAPGDYESFMERLPYFLALMPEYANKEGFSIFTHSWTVGVELKFYLFFPPVVFLLIRNAKARVAVTAIVVVLLTAIDTFRSQSYCALLFGVMLAFALETPRGYAVIATLTRVPVIVPLALIVALFALLHVTEQFTAVAIVATYLVAYAIVQEARVSRLLTSTPLVWLGQRSYGAYLLHFLALRIGYMIFGSDTAAGGLMSAGFCLAATALAADLMYRAIERPAIEWGRQLAQGRRSASS